MDKSVVLIQKHPQDNFWVETVVQFRIAPPEFLTS